MEIKPVSCTQQLGVVRYHDITGAIDVLFLRVGCQQVGHFVGALWIYRKYSVGETAADIRLWTMVIAIV